MAALLLSRRAHLLTTHKMGGGIPFGVVRSARLCGSFGALCTMPHFFKLLSLSTQFPQVQPLMRLSAGVQNCTLPCANCLRKSATGSFIAEIGAASDRTYFLFQKKKSSEHSLDVHIDMHGNKNCAAAQEGGK